MIDTIDCSTAPRAPLRRTAAAQRVSRAFLARAAPRGEAILRDRGSWASTLFRLTWRSFRAGRADGPLPVRAPRRTARRAAGGGGSPGCCDQGEGGAPPAPRGGLRVGLAAAPAPLGLLPAAHGACGGAAGRAPRRLARPSRASCVAHVAVGSRECRVRAEGAEGRESCAGQRLEVGLLAPPRL